MCSRLKEVILLCDQLQLFFATNLKGVEVDGSAEFIVLLVKDKRQVSTSEKKENVDKMSRAFYTIYHDICYRQCHFLSAASF